MQRRTVLKNFLILAAGTVVLPACRNDRSNASIPLKNLKVDGDGEKLLAEISETFIPKTAIPGAKDVYAHLYTLKMLDDCYTPEQQRQFETGLKDLDKLSTETHSMGFLKSSPAQRTQLLASLDGRKKGDALYEFYQMAKALTVQGYMTSKYVMTEITKYELVPGRYNGFAPVKSVYHHI